MKALKKIREQVEKGGQNQGTFPFVCVYASNSYAQRLACISTDVPFPLSPFPSE